MLDKINPRFWVYEILTGKYPEKTRQYIQIDKQYEIISLYERIFNIVYICAKNEKKQIKAMLKSREDVVEKLYENVCKSYKKLNGKKITIFFLKSTRLQFIFKENNDIAAIFLYVPLADDVEL